jgi:hypothetical protein
MQAAQSSEEDEEDSYGPLDNPHEGMSDEVPDSDGEAYHPEDDFNFQPK